MKTLAATRVVPQVPAPSCRRKILNNSTNLSIESYYSLLMNVLAGDHIAFVTNAYIIILLLILITVLTLVPTTRKATTRKVVKRAAVITWDIVCLIVDDENANILSKHSVVIIVFGYISSYFSLVAVVMRDARILFRTLMTDGVQT